MTTWSVVIPTVGRQGLFDLLDDLAAQVHHPDAIYVVDDRRQPEGRLPVDATILQAGGHGPARARNLGWRAADTEWIAFLDDDVRLSGTWSEDLLADLESAAPSTAGIQGAIVVPRPTDRPSTDWERSTAGLETARWATADMAYRRQALQDVDGFDERFPRAYREDAELALRIRRAGWILTRGGRYVIHPVRREGFWVSVRVQRGNADDALMRAIYGRHWRRLAECPPGRFKAHVATVAAAVLATKYRRLGGVAWLGLTLELIARRIAPGPRTPDEIARMTATSVVLPFAAVWHRLRGAWRHRRSTAWPGPVRAVLFDRDGTLVEDVPYNGDPERVELVRHARESVERLRTAGLQVGVVTNQSGIGRGLLTAEQVAEVNRRIDDLIGPFQTWQVCPHAPADGCACRKPAAGLVLSAAAELGVPPRQIVVIGDIAADLAAAEAAGARSVLVPNRQTRTDEILAARTTAPDLAAAVDHVLAASGAGR
ncbi:HAD-IIIA family hydrolase [Kribbella monticola]|uniref:HAD-IIIA family hydrolase n=1 Tax=Kribbella monticola TaxID=2185285 RepID=UPI000DD45B24|nr:HAD-IIIA family hydrolase [Kribbella monticola]